MARRNSRLAAAPGRQSPVPAAVWVAAVDQPRRRVTTSQPDTRPPRKNGRCTTVTYAAKASRTSTQ